jgi:type IV secretory pathway VirB2 component (pilin)
VLACKRTEIADYRFLVPNYLHGKEELNMSILASAKDKSLSLAKKVTAKKAIATSFATSLAISMASFASATGYSDTIATNVKTGLGSVYTVITAIVVPIAVIALAFCAFQFFMGGERGVEKAKKTLLYLVIGVALVYLAPVLVSSVASWFSGVGNANVFS